MQVFKFGGASVRDAKGVRNLVEILQNHSPDQLLLVISAMGKTTNALELVVDAYYHGNSEAAIAKLQDLKRQHQEIARELHLDSLLSTGLLNDLFVEAEWLLEDELHDSYDYIYDQTVAIGELLATRIVHAYLQTLGFPVVWVDARDLIKTDDAYRTGRVDWLRTTQKVLQIVRPLIDGGHIVITPGFIGSTLENNTITLGREGSDYSAAIFAAILSAKSLTVWKDVPGIMTSDPYLFNDAQLMPRIDYREAIEMTYYGARVIHPKTIKPLMDRQIPLFVRSFETPEVNGTVVHDFPALKYPPVKVVLSDQTLLQLYTREFTFVMEDHLSEIFQLAVEHKIRIHLMENLALSLSLVIQADAENVDAFIGALRYLFDITQTNDLQLCTIRHYEKPVVESMKKNRKVYIEEYNATTAQLVLG